MCRDLVTSLDNLFQYSIHHHCFKKNQTKGKKKCFSDKTSCASPYACCLLSFHYRAMEKNLSLSSFHQAFMHMDKITPISSLDSPSPLSLSPHKKCSKLQLFSWPSAGTVPVAPSMICTEELSTGHHSRCASSVLSRGEGPPL